MFQIFTDFSQLKSAFILLFLFKSNHSIIHATNDTSANAKLKFIVSRVSDQYVVENRLAKREFQIVGSDIEPAIWSIALDMIKIDGLHNGNDNLNLIFEQKS